MKKLLNPCSLIQETKKYYFFEQLLLYVYGYLQDLQYFIENIQLLFNCPVCLMDSAKRKQNYQEANCVADSGVTRTSQQFKVRKKITLKSCQSVISVEDNQNKSMSLVERKLFLQFISLKNHQRKKAQCLDKMKIYYLNGVEQKEKKYNRQHNFILDELPQEFNKQDLEVISYFFNTWLQFIGYGSQKNKRMILSKLAMLIPRELIPQAIKFYQNLGFNYIKGVQRYRMLQGLCENGWQTFIRVAYTEIMKKQGLMTHN